MGCQNDYRKARGDGMNISRHYEIERQRLENTTSFESDTWFRINDLIKSTLLKNKSITDNHMKNLIKENPDYEQPLKIFQNEMNLNTHYYMVARLNQIKKELNRRLNNPDYDKEQDKVKIALKKITDNLQKE